MEVPDGISYGRRGLYDKVIFILEPSEPAKAAIGKYVTVFDYPDGRLVIRYNGIDLPYRTFDKVRQVDEAADSRHCSPGAFNSHTTIYPQILQIPTPT